MDTIKLNSIDIEKVVGGGTKIKYNYTTCPYFDSFLRKNTIPLFVEYPAFVEISEIPQAILSVPFVANMLTTTMLLGIAIDVSELDLKFFESILDIEQVYRSMYPYSRLKFKVNVKNTVDCSYVSSGKRSLFFTGGLDATSALIQTYREKPLLINIWGGDVSTHDELSHANLANYMYRLTNNIGNAYVFIKSNCREMYNEEKVTKLWATRISPFKNHGWWANIGHILSMTSLIAPLVYSERIDAHDIGSSYDSKSSTFDANNSELLNAIKFGSLKFISVDEGRNRLQKAQTVIDFCRETNIPIDLKVCWYRQAGHNCSKCEKCYRTIMNIIANNGDPNKFGFTVTSNTFKLMHKYLLDNYVNVEYWIEIQSEFRKRRTHWEKDEDIAWILDFKFNSIKAIGNKFVTAFKRLFNKDMSK